MAETVCACRVEALARQALAELVDAEENVGLAPQVGRPDLPLQVHNSNMKLLSWVPTRPAGWNSVTSYPFVPSVRALPKLDIFGAGRSNADEASRCG